MKFNMLRALHHPKHPSTENIPYRLYIGNRIKKTDSRRWENSRLSFFSASTVVVAAAAKLFVD